MQRVHPSEICNVHVRCVYTHVYVGHALTQVAAITAAQAALIHMVSFLSDHSSFSPYILLPARAFVSSHSLPPGPALRHHDWELALQKMMCCLTQFLTPCQCLQAAAMVSAEDGAGFSREVLNRETSRTSRTMVVEAEEAAAAEEEVVAAPEEVEAAAEEEEVFFPPVPSDFP